MARIMRKVRTGAVVRTPQDKTAIVEMVWKQRHRLYRKQMRRVARFYVHDPESQCRLGDTVRIEETRPISKNKHWRLLSIVERKQIADVRPIDVETDVAPEMTQPRILAAEARAEAAEAAAVDVADETPVVEAVAVEEEPAAEVEAVADEPVAEVEAVADEPVAEVETVADEVVEEEPEIEEPAVDEADGDGDTGDDEQEDKE